MQLNKLYEIPPLFIQQVCEAAFVYEGPIDDTVSCFVVMFGSGMSIMPGIMKTDSQASWIVRYINTS